MHLILALPAHVIVGEAHEPSRGYGATAAHLTPDQKVGSLNLSALNSCWAVGGASGSKEFPLLAAQVKPLQRLESMKTSLVFLKI